MPLQRPIPVHVTYLTAWAERDGTADRLAAARSALSEALEASAFAIDDLTIADAATTAEAPDPEEGGEESSGTTSVRCDVPRDVKVFDGLAMTMRIDAGATEDALVVPVTAVRGLLDHGTVWVMADDGTPAERAVELGVNDGKVIEVTKGLDEGEEVLQYVPGSGPEDELGGDLMYAEEL